MIYILEKTILVHGSHQLQDTDSLVTKECHNVIHGHDYYITIKIEVNKIIDGMVIDFGRLNQIIFFGKNDHVNYNQWIENPTAENIAIYYYTEINKELFKRYRGFILEVKVEESRNNSVTIR